ncbi:sporulation protein YqfD [Anaerotignum sp. MB30-C6]|uniref:sporulation protein YqfD n=1 Tax=Anaerotignum sp. MB30-C6 TaxID=3070814 RepID=UPI0027DE3F72|nr:sporulation protein YqfD [Anaerotignum sp. MB30-C6]WMI81416.1 sporulation protein YqfD [Anaerotignum sp. MB30-C6]
MFLALWYYFRGYVMIKVNGFAAERFMNMLSYRGVYLWDVESDGAGVRLKVPMGSMDMVSMCAEKTGCRLEVQRYGGFPAKAHRFKGRQVLTAGVLIFAAGLYLLSSFIWVIRVEGNDRVAVEDILTYCQELGLKPAAWKRGVHPEEITKELLVQFPDISWVSVGIKGTDVTIKIAETIEKTEVLDKETPCDVIANMDGVILKITAERGTPMVKEGDVVKKGDVLISSEVLIGLEGEEQHVDYVAAEGTVKAKVWQQLTEELPLTYEEKIYTGETKTNKILSFWGKDADFIHPSMDDAKADVEVLFEKDLALGDFKVPISIKKEQYNIYILESRSRTVDEAKAELEETLRNKTEQCLGPYGTIEKIEVHFEEYTDCVRAKGQAVLTERIDEKRKVEKGRDAVDGTDRENHATGQ